jgi:lambda family phage portal protein
MDEGKKESANSPNWLDKTLGFIAPEYQLKRQYYKNLLEFGYDGAKPDRFRESVGGLMTNSASESLANQRDRLKLMAEARNLCMNYSFFKSILLKESMYVAGSMRYQSQTGNPEVDAEYERYWKEWTERCDLTGRHSFIQLIQLAHMSMRRDGDFGFAMVTHGDDLVLQCVEADRLGHPHKHHKENNYIGGITLNELGQPLTYRIYKRTIHGQYEQPREIPASNFVHYFDPMRTDQYRGITAFETAIPHARDLYELLAMEKQAVKWGASHAGVITKADPGPDKWTTKKDAGTLDPKKLEKTIPGKIVRLAPGDGITMFPTNSRPSATFNGFISTLVREMANGLNLPYAFVWDMSQFGGVTARLEVQQAQRAFERHQRILQEKVLNPIKNAVIARAIAFRKLPAVPNYRTGKWQFNSQITADLGNETQSNLSMQQAGMKTHEAILGELGLDFEEETEKMAKEIRYIADMSQKYGVPIEMISQRLEGGTQMLANYQQLMQPEQGDPLEQAQGQAEVQKTNAETQKLMADAKAIAKGKSERRR